MKYLELTFLILILHVISISTVSGDNRRAPLRVACNLPLTGELSTYGTAVREGAQFFLKTLSNSDKDQISFDWQDNEGKGVRTLTIAQLQLQKKPDMYVSGVKPQYMSIEKILGGYPNLPHVAWIFDSHLRAKNKNNFRVWVNFKREAEIFLELMKNKQDIKKIAIIHVVTPTVVEQQQDIIIPGLRALDKNEPLVIPYQIDQIDFKSIALKVKKYKPDFIFLSAFQHNMIPLIRTLRTLGLIHDDNTVATYDLLDALHLMKEEELRDIRFIMPAFIVAETKELIDMQVKFKTEFNKDPLYTHIYGYEMAVIMFDVSQRALSFPHKSIIQLMQETNMRSITGDLRFNSEGDVETEVVYGHLKNGKIEKKY